MADDIKRRFRWAHVVLWMAFLCGFASLASWMPVFNLWLSKKGMDGVQIGYLSSIPWVVMLAVQPLLGMLADKYGKMLLLRLTLVCAAAALVAVPMLSADVTSTVMMTILFSLFNTPILPLLDSITLDRVESDGNTAYSYFRFWGAPGYAIGALVTGDLMATYGVEAMFYSSAGFLFLMMICLIVYRPSKTITPATDMSFRQTRSIFTSRVMIRFLVVVVVVSAGQSAINFFLTIYLDEIGSSPQNSGRALAVQALSELPFYFISVWLLRRLQPARIMVITIFFTALRLSLYALNHNPYLVIFVETLNGITWTLFWIASVEFVNRKVSAEWRTTGQSLLWAAYFGAGAVLGNLLSGSIYEVSNMHTVYTVNSILVLIVAVLSVYFFSGTSGRTKPLNLKTTL